ncbi:aldehyde dehydrogenase family protein [Fundicoccus culcitae]|uniref:Aldehyde dehydrogenase family protein n=1 Tax=Fundicoccus culcitae TaxID=2969821 RepID=A0ABY5P9V9_9LACT|nr:aldehyde dehydrogenase family protein [Fundicoccus culcitae]UUX35522.1 aldehyde dehydrogenase family protein [Fundicoccus culcitae]
MEKHKIYINGQWQAGTSGQYTDVMNPATEAVVAQVTTGSVADIDEAVAAAKNAFTAWNLLAPAERAGYIKKVRQGIEDRQEELAQAMVAELGCSISFARATQVGLSLTEMDATLEEFEHFAFEETLDSTLIIKEGTGVVAAITPWNYPLNQIQRKITPALLAGNTVVVKPANETPLAAIILAEIIDAAGLPAGVFNLVTGKGSEIGNYLAGHEDVALISFTGSTDVGRGLYAQAAPHIKRLVLELGGKSAMIYLEGGNLEGAIKQTADTIINNTGQSCSALTRLLVPSHLLDEVKDALRNYFSKQAIVGDPTLETTTVGPISSKKQFDTVMEYIAKGKAEGAEVLIGGNAIEGTGYFIEPTVFTNVTNDMTIAREEIFGPVLTVLTYDTVEEAIAIANDSTYGLSGAVVGPPAEAEKVARQLRTGNIYVNNGPRNSKAPFGGYKESGIGRENGLYGVEDYLEIKALFK